MAVAFILLIVCVLWGLKWLFGSGGSSLSHLPRRKGWPIIGNILQLDTKRPDVAYLEWTKNLGDIFVVKLFSSSFVVLNSFEAIYELLVKKGDHFAGRPLENNFRLQFYSKNFQSIAICNPSARWKQMRRTVQRQLKMYDDRGQKQIEDLVVDVMGRLVTQFRESSGKPFNPRQAVYNTIVNSMTSMLIAKTFRVDEEEFRLITDMERDLQSSLMPSGEGVELDIFPFLRHFGNKTFKKLKRVDEMIDQLWLKVQPEITEKNMKEEEPMHIMQALYNLYKNQAEHGLVNENQLEEFHLKLALSDMVIAGVTTSSNTFYPYLNIISQYPEVQRKLQQEVDLIIGSDRPVSLKDRPDMPYALATVLELLRFTSVAPLGLAHLSLQETSVQGHRIPVGVMLITNLWAMHHDDRFWPKPFEFIPERFLEPDGQLVSASHENRKHLMPFGGGTRVCVGERLALGRLFLLVATAAQMFSIEQGPVKVPCDPKLYDTGETLYPPDMAIIAISRNDKLYT